MTERTRTVYFNMKSPDGTETVDEINLCEFDSRREFLDEAKRLKTEYQLAGMNVYFSQRACAGWD